jgi:hypothetical protein
MNHGLNEMFNEVAIYRFFFTSSNIFHATKNAQKNEKKGGLRPLPSWAES